MYSNSPYKECHEEIFNNNELTSLIGLDSLLSVGGNFEIYSNSDLVETIGPESLTQVLGNLTIASNSLNAILLFLSPAIIGVLAI